MQSSVLSTHVRAVSLRFTQRVGTGLFQLPAHLTAQLAARRSRADWFQHNLAHTFAVYLDSLRSERVKTLQKEARVEGAPVDPATQNLWLDLDPLLLQKRRKRSRAQTQLRDRILQKFSREFLPRVIRIGLHISLPKKYFLWIGRFRNLPTVQADFAMCLRVLTQNVVPKMAPLRFSFLYCWSAGRLGPGRISKRVVLPLSFEVKEKKYGKAH